MKRAQFFVITVVVVCILIVGIIVLNIIRDQREDTQNVDLHLPSGRTEQAIVQQYTNACTPTNRPRSAFPANVIGLSMNAPPIDEIYYVLAKELGISWMRASFNWRDIERPDGTYDWALADVLVEELRAHNFQILANITLLPTHLHTWEEIESHFKLFTHAFAERYADKGMSYYEIFNEPNLSGWGWLDRVTRPEGYIGEYTILLAIANQEIHRVDPRAVIVSGGISSDDVTGMPYPAFITQFLSYGGKQCFDIFAFHPYGHEEKFTQTTHELHTLLGDTKASSTPIWFNEYGTDQDKKLAYSIESMHNERNVVDAWFWFTLRDLRPNHRWSYGLTDYNYEKKEAFSLFAELFSKI